MIGQDGKNLGLVPLEQALDSAQKRGLDLVQITDKVEPPVCKIQDYGKYLYQQRKKGKTERTKKTGGIKSVRLTFKISHHDLETRLKKAKQFLEQGQTVRIEMKLRGREHRLTDFAREKVNEFLKMITQNTPVRIERELKKERMGLAMIISKK